MAWTPHRLAGIAIAGAALSTPAFARNSDGAVSLAVTGGTLGVGPQLGFRASPTIGLRADATLLTIGHGFDSDDIDYHGRLHLRSAGAMVDVYPWGGGFRISAGARINGNRARVRATPTRPTEIGGETFTPEQIGTITGRARVKDFAPALTLGYGGRLGRGFVVTAEAGALFQGRIRIRDFTADGTLADDLRFQQQLELERQDLQHDVDDYHVYPIAQLSLGYRF